MALPDSEYLALKQACRKEMPHLRVRLDVEAATAVAALAMTAAVAYDASELQAVADKVDALISALQTAGIMSST